MTMETNLKICKNFSKKTASSCYNLAGRKKQDIIRKYIVSLTIVIEFSSGSLDSIELREKFLSVATNKYTYETFSCL